jgi:prepilin-type processing-associated H-X9-DG protein
MDCKWIYFKQICSPNCKGEEMMSRKAKCFTLMEMLVVISVIALLLAVLMPSLQKAKEMAGRMVCANHERQLSLANHLYADSWDEQFCPPMMENINAPKGPPDERRKNWLLNDDFRKYIALDDKLVADDQMVMPDEYFCPADKIARYDEESQYGVLVSYAYNVAQWYYPKDEIDCFWAKNCCKCTTESNPTWQIGHKRTAISRASEKINFVDSVDWWGTWQKGANYKIGWDVLGQAPRDKYAELKIWGPILYRHNEGANFAFYDGHVEHLSKEEAYIEKKGALPLQDATGMWYVSQP